MGDVKISDSVIYIGADDRAIDLFESQYKVPNGVSYNSYVILDEKTAVMDTADNRVTDVWLDKLEKALDGRKLDYLVVQHMEPDHSGNIQRLAEKYPEMRLVGNAKTFAIMKQFFTIDGLDERCVTVKEGDTLSLGSHTLQFIMAPMVHWPEVMVTYEQSEKLLFSADGFGKFGALDADEDWACEARRYYFNIVGKYGAQVQALLKKAAALDIKMILPLHGPVLKENLGYYIDKYNVWSSYEPEDKGVLIAYASIHGHTAAAAEELARMLKERGAEKTVLTDLSRTDMSEAVEDAFRYDRMVLMAASYDGGVFPVMEDFLLHLKSKLYQNRKIGIVENGSWGPTAGRVTRSYAEGYKNVTIAEPAVTIRSALNEASRAALAQLADAMTVSE
ncbi:FprA family A-type flavoprotein [Ruminococcus sp. Marseille-P6503]|uniref:FprA family A-type flavoprotein n=1 Tax=Ruminococcus sp. Marseille-P6503 TaxID=2364796 RepID=UPI000F547E6C|nr:FprA family A-type flavoprotein [Ruminococcus sp. Marseille-P6503]